MDKLKIGVIGTGHLGKLHVKMFKMIDNCELVGVYDQNLEQAKIISEDLLLFPIAVSVTPMV